MKKTSARNAFTGTINRITRGNLLVEVEIVTSTGLKVVAVITSESADNLELREGMNTTATIKAPWVILSTGLAAGARNHFPGTVQSIRTGEIEAEVTSPFRRSETVCAVITAESARSLNLEPGHPFPSKAFAVVAGDFQAPRRPCGDSKRPREKRRPGGSPPKSGKRLVEKNTSPAIRGRLYCLEEKRPGPVPPHLVPVSRLHQRGQQGQRPSAARARSAG